MTTFVKYLEGVKSKLGIRSDRAFALRIGITQPAIHNIMAGMTTPSDDTCMKIAELAGDEPARVIALAHMAKASGASRKAWDKIFKAVTAATFALSLTLNASAAAKLLDTLYIMSNRARRRFAALCIALFGSLVSPALGVILLVLFIQTPAYAEDRAPWSSTDTALELTYQVLRVMDWRQTVYITQHQPEYGEANGTLSGNMTHGNVNRYMAFIAIGHSAVSYILPPGSPRTLWQSITIVEVGAAVHHNRRIGIGMSFSF